MRLKCKKYKKFVDDSGINSRQSVEKDECSAVKEPDGGNDRGVFDNIVKNAKSRKEKLVEISKFVLSISVEIVCDTVLPGHSNFCTRYRTRIVFEDI